MIVREAVPKDDGALLRIESASAQGDTLRLAEDRASFFHRARRFERSLVLVGENETTGALLGVMAAAPVTVRVGGEYRKAAYMFDLRNNAEAGGGLSKALYIVWKHFEKRLKSEGVEMLFGYVKEDNSRAMTIFTRMGATRRAGFTHFTKPVLPKRAVRGAVEVARRVDVAGYRAEIAQRYGGHDLWPHIDDLELLQSGYDRSVRARVTCGRASALIIDPSLDERRRVMKMPPLYHVAGPIARPLSSFLPIPYIPKLGQELRVWHLLDIVAGGRPEELAAVLAQANNMAREEGVHYLAAAASPVDAEAQALARPATARLNYNIMAVDWAQGVPAMLPATYFDPRSL